MASQPRYSRSGENGNGWVFVLLPMLAVAGGFLAYRSWLAVAVALGLPGLLLSPFTTPRGDNDGLWTLIVPMMVGLIAVMLLLAWMAASARGSLSSHELGSAPVPPIPDRFRALLGTPSDAVPAQWAPDPSGRHQYRYFNGQGWTPHVSDDGVQGSDPLP